MNVADKLTYVAWGALLLLGLILAAANLRQARQLDDARRQLDRTGQRAADLRARVERWKARAWDAENHLTVLRDRLRAHNLDHLNNLANVDEHAEQAMRPLWAQPAGWHHPVPQPQAAEAPHRTPGDTTITTPIPPVRDEAYADRAAEIEGLAT